MTDGAPRVFSPPRWTIYILALGWFLTLRGYQSRDGDQAYRLPILLHRQDPTRFAGDPFVAAFAVFNPHRGALAVLDGASRLVGLSGALAALFGATFVVSCAAIDRLARAVWPERGSRVGLVAIALVLTAHAGNIGTNHLFEPMLLDRLMGFGLGWLAFSFAVADLGRGWWKASLALGLAAFVHPSVGLQLALGLAAATFGWALFGLAEWRAFVCTVVGVAAAIAPGVAMNLGQGKHLLEGLPYEEFRLLSVELQGPQHMLPHLWRWTQWLAWGCYPLLALLALVRRSWPPARARLAILLGVVLAAIAASWVAVEVVHDLRVTLFQPFRMATVARGLALVALSGRVLGLWRQNDLSGRVRACLLLVGLAGDWALIVATAVDLAAAAADFVLGRMRPAVSAPRANGFSVCDRPAIVSAPCEGGDGGVIVAGSTVEVAHVDANECRVTAREPTVRAGGVLSALLAPSSHGGDRDRSSRPGLRAAGCALIGPGVFAAGLIHLARHDTESGHVPLIAAALVGVICTVRGRRGSFEWTARRFAVAVLLAWLVPLAALAVELDPRGSWPHSNRWAKTLAAHCRFAAVPLDDIERLADWCRNNTPQTARFVGPPGAKAFRLWSERCLAFNRAASPYHAVALADWSARYRDHVGFTGSTRAFVGAYLADRHRLERGYDARSDAERAALAVRQGASYVIAATRADGGGAGPGSPLELLHAEGRYAVYRVRPATLARSGLAPAGH
jgi:hypothetical protein